MLHRRLVEEDTIYNLLKLIWKASRKFNKSSWSGLQYFMLFRLYEHSCLIHWRILSVTLVTEHHSYSFFNLLWNWMFMSENGIWIFLYEWIVIVIPIEHFTIGPNPTKWSDWKIVTAIIRLIIKVSYKPFLNIWYSSFWMLQKSILDTLVIIIKLLITIISNGDKLGQSNWWRRDGSDSLGTTSYNKNCYWLTIIFSI